MAQTVRAILERGIAILEAQYIESPRSSGEALLMHVLGLPVRSDLYIRERVVDPIEELQYFSLIAKRSTGYPLQYILGTVQCGDDLLQVREGILIPRPETEWGVMCLPEIVGDKHIASVLDIGTGSGCIAIHVARLFPCATVVGVDISSQAVQCARENVARAGLDTRVEIRESDLFQSVRPEEHFDMIISNPPYITQREMYTLPREVRYEPYGALYGGNDGLDYYRRISDNAPPFMRHGGVLVFEIGAGQGARVEELCRERGFSHTRLLTDDNGYQRILITEWHGK